MNRLNAFWFDIERIENFHKPWSGPIKAWYIEPTQKFWVDYAIKNKIIKEEDKPEGYNPNAFNILKHINPLAPLFRKKKPKTTA